MARGVWLGVEGKDIRHIEEGKLVWDGRRGLWPEAEGRR